MKTPPPGRLTVCRLSICLVLGLVLTGCWRHASPVATLKPTAFGSAIAEISGGKQAGTAGAALDQPVVVQVNDAQGNAVAGAAVYFRGPSGVDFNPSAGLTDASGQLSASVTLGQTAGRYELSAQTTDSSGKRAELKMEEIALGYREKLGRQLVQQYCARCHDPESTPERVSNIDNLTARPHQFTDGATLNRFSDADLQSIIGHGGPALSRSPEMPPYGYTLGKNQIDAIVAYIRAIADPPYRPAGVIYAQK